MWQRVNVVIMTVISVYRPSGGTQEVVNNPN